MQIKMAARCRHICTKFGLMELVNLILLRDMSVNGMVSLGMKMDRKVWKKYICERIQDVGRQSWKNGFNDTEREKEYVEMKRCPRNESFADGSVGARVKLMVRGGCLPVRGCKRMAGKYDDDCCGCGKVVTEEHVLFECNCYREELLRWRGVIKMKDGRHEYDVIKGYKLKSAEIEKETMQFLRVMWNNRHRHEWVRETDWHDVNGG